MAEKQCVKPIEASVFFRLMTLRVFYCFCCLLFAIEGAGQHDSTRTRILDTKLSQKAISSVKRKPKPDNVVAAKSEEAFLPFEGKIIRNIIINKVGFEKSIYDSSRNFKSKATRIANSLHTNSREGVIRDNLFIRKNKPLNPYRLADNERHLRDLDFILDSKIEVCLVNGSEDSVDVEVYTRDVFSIGFKLDPEKIDAIQLDVFDANLLGQGQRVQVNTLIDLERNPQLGSAFLYKKSSLGGTLINPTIGYTQINTGRSNGPENEHAFFIRLDRPLVSPYSRMAGGIEVSKNYSVNNYQIPKVDFRKYRYHLEDTWIGYNMGIKNNTNSRERHFASMRYYNQSFERIPDQVDQQKNPDFINQQFLLSSISFYEQNFYKTQYVFGFGRTEDIPYGKTLTFTGGWSSRNGNNRTYLGFNTTREFVTKKGNFYQIGVGAGSHFSDDSSEDTFIFSNGEYYSKLVVKNNIKVRQRIEGGYAQAFNNKLQPLLTLENQFPGFRPDSLFGFKRACLRTETTIFTNWKIAGFNFAGFASAESAFFQEKPDKDIFEKFLWGITSGFRIRNENLIFGTVEVRSFYFPGTLKGIENFSFQISTNVRLKYTATFVRPPSFVNYN